MLKMHMVKTRDPSADTALCAAFLRLVGAQGWAKLTLDTLAKAAKIPLKTLQTRFKTVNALIPVVAAEIDREAIAAAGRGSGNAHDKLFDLLMARFDVMQKHRAAIENMAQAARRNRGLSLALGKATLDSAYRLIDAAKIDAPFPPRPVIAAGLIAVYGWAFCVWRKDKSRDMAKTMAAIDRGLRWAHKGASLFKARS